MWVGRWLNYRALNLQINDVPCLTRARVADYVGRAGQGADALPHGVGSSVEESQDFKGVVHARNVEETGLYMQA